MILSSLNIKKRKIIWNKNNEFHYAPVKDGITNEGAELKLGFMCYVSKIIYTLNVWNSFNEETKKSWVDEINSYQDEDFLNAKNSYVDPAFLRLSSKINMIDMSSESLFQNESIRNH